MPQPAGAKGQLIVPAGSDLINGHIALQSLMEEGTLLLNVIQDVDLDTKITVA